MKRLRVIFLAALVLALLCALVACGAEIDSGTTNGENPGGNTADAGGTTSGENNGNGTAGGGEHTHAHTYSDTWSQDATYHWHAATCEHTNEIKDKAEHNYVDGTCSVCGRVQMAGAESLQYALSADQKAYHVVGVGTEQKKNLVIPESYRDLPVTEIADEAFFGCTWLKSVVIPSSVTKIGEDAFSGCTSLQSVVIPTEVSTVAESIFSGCTSLRTLTLPAGALVAIPGVAKPTLKTVVVNGGETIGARVFVGYTALTEITIASSVTTIESGAFSGCGNLTDVRYSGTLAEWCNITGLNELMPNGRTLYINGTEVTGELVIPAGVTAIPDSAFLGSSVTGVTIPTSVVGIGKGAFKKCEKLSAIHYTGTVSEWCNITGLNYLMADGRTLYINGAEITGELVIPEGVTEIPIGAFIGCIGLTSVTIPNSVTSIGRRAFAGCTGITSITISANITSIGQDALSDCTGIVSATLPTTVIGSIPKNALTTLVINGGESVDNFAFIDYAGLTSVTIGNSVTSVGDYAFCRCTGLTSVTIGNGVTSIGGSAFFYCTELVSITIPASVTNIGGDAFSGCSNLNKIYYLGTLSEWCNIIGLDYLMVNGSTLYMNGAEIAGELVIPEGVTEIPAYAFIGCKGLTSVIIPDSVTHIGNRAFAGCTGFTKITIPDSVTSIGGGAFADCTGITSITISANTTNVASNAFSGCTGIVSATLPTTVIGSIPKNALTTLVINGGESIDNFAFIDYAGLTSVTIPDSVTSIGYVAFHDCKGLTSITIPNSVTSIENRAFEDCVGLTSITADTGNTKYHSNGNCLIETESKTLILGCKNSVIPSDGSVTSIGSGAFSGCTELTSITIPDSVTSIGYAAFEGCKGLTFVTIPNSVTSIDDSTFKGCTGLTSVTIPDSVTSIGGWAFRGCTGLTSVTIGNSVTSIGYQAFSHCTGLTSVTIGNSVTSIGDEVFCGCTGLTSVTIGGSVTSIGQNTFSGCTRLMNIQYNGTKEQWKAIKKTSEWSSNTGDFVVHCTDGDIN